MSLPPLLTLILLAAPALAADEEAARHFEARVRPVLAEHCYGCHSARARKVQGGLLLDSRAGLLRGGDAGPALVPGRPAESRLIDAVRYANADLQMPPKRRLSDEQVADLAAWVERGAPWPAEAPPPTPTTTGRPDMAARRAAHWAWQPVRPQPLPEVRDTTWPATRADRFILAGLEAAGLTPAPPTDPRTLLRRAAFALTGLPPAPEEAEAFARGPSRAAFAREVDRLLASPHFGERWARHWMDLVRYADTLGNEADMPIPNAWRYRDYLVRAFNADLPYDQLVVEHLAGDLLPNPRRRLDNGDDEASLGTGFFWMGEGKRSPVDLRQAQADLFDNRIDVATKAFLGLTVACARCHDHKFDAIPQEDYYGLYGYLKSSRYTQALLNRDETAAAARQLNAAHAEAAKAAVAAWSAEAEFLPRYLAATLGGPADELAPDRLKLWRQAAGEADKAPAHPLHAWARVAALGPRPTAEALAMRWNELRGENGPSSTPRRGDVALFNPDAPARSWTAEDQAFGPAPLRPGAVLLDGAAGVPTLFPGPASWEHSGQLARRLQGTLRSPTFTIDRRYLHVLTAGRASRLNVVIEQFVMIQDPLYGRLRIILNDDAPSWHTFDLDLWRGRSAYLELADTTTPDLHDMRPPDGCGAEGYAALGAALLSDLGNAPPLANPGPTAALGADAPATPAALAERYRLAVAQALATGENTTAGPAASARLALTAGLVARGLLAPVGENAACLANALRAFRDAESALPAPRRAPALTEGGPEDEHLFIRGNWKTAGPLVPRHAPSALEGTPAPPGPPPTGSGRLDLARRFASPSNPLAARVLVNRVWHHLFGRGLVPSVDNFGALGDRPTHPALLDDLAGRFVQQGWSLKRLVRELVLSETFRMASAPDEKGEALDPDNARWHRMTVRRLEAEAIRDAMLATSGRLNRQPGGPGVEVHLTPFMDGYGDQYGRPKASGPLDGDGRRSLYLNVRRNFPNPLLAAFDDPPPLSTVGRRPVSNVPAQALILMNDPFVAEQATRWARRALAPPGLGPPARVRAMYEQAFARPPSPEELRTALAFLDRQGADRGIPAAERPGSEALWADLAHVLFNVKEFVFVK